MNAVTPIALSVPHVIKGELVRGGDVEYGRFGTPKLDLSALIWRRNVPPPAADTPSAEILDILVALGDWLSRDPQGAVEEAFLASKPLATLEAGLLERAFRQLGGLFDRRFMQFEIDQHLGGVDVLDGWREISTPTGRSVRASGRWVRYSCSLALC